MQGQALQSSLVQWSCMGVVNNLVCNRLSATVVGDNVYLLIITEADFGNFTDLWTGVIFCDNLT